MLRAVAGATGAGMNMMPAAGARGKSTASSPHELGLQQRLAAGPALGSGTNNILYTILYGIKILMHR
jgi:hypothetical protein